jgi:type IV pilus assembly protein PilA
MKTRYEGFSLIELMIVIAIIGILAAVAVPSYQSYVQKSHYAEIFSAASAAETAVSEYVMSNGGPGTSCANVVFSYPTTNTVASVAIAGDSTCVVTVVGGATAFGTDIPTVKFTPGTDSTGTGSIQWGCAVTPTTLTGIPSTCQTPTTNFTPFT